MQILDLYSTYKQFDGRFYLDPILENLLKNFRT